MATEGGGPGRPSRSSVVDTALQEVLARSGMGSWRWDAGADAVCWDTTMEQLSGLEPGTFAGTFDAWVATIHPDDQARALTEVADAVERGSSYQIEYRVVRPDGTERWLECRGEVTLDEAGRHLGTVGCALDITDRKEAEGDREELLARYQVVTDRLERLERVSRALTAATTVEEVARATVELTAIPSTPGGRGLWVADGEETVLTLMGVEGRDAASMREFESIPLTSSLPAAQAFHTRQTVTSLDRADAHERFPDLDGAKRTSVGFAALPLLAGSQCLGVLAVGFDEALAEVDLDFLEAVAAHVAQTLERVRLTEAAAERAVEAEHAAESERLHRLRLELLGRINDVLTESRTVEEILINVTRAAVPWFGDWCTIYLLPDGGGTLPEIRLATSDPAMQQRAARLQRDHPFDPGAPVGVARVMRTGRSEFFPDLTEAVLEALPVSSLQRTLIRELGWRSAIAVPLVKTGELLGALQFVMGEHARRYTHDDLALSEAVAARVASSIRNRRLTEKQRLIAKTLQAGLLPERLHDLEGLETAVRYWAAGTGTEVGGDFYDVFRLDDDRCATVIGDVCGTGPAAASLTALARHTVRACLRRGDDQQTTFEQLNRELLETASDRFLTIASVILQRDGDGFLAQTCCAGHPLPILVRADGTTAVLGRPGSLIGVFDSLSVHLGVDRLEPGDTLVLYTDGVTDVAPPNGLSGPELIELVHGAAWGASSAEAVADGIHRRIEQVLPVNQRGDDIALLVLRARS